MHSKSTLAETGRPHLRMQVSSAATPVSSVGQRAMQSIQRLQVASCRHACAEMLHARKVHWKQLFSRNGRPGVRLAAPASASGGTTVHAARMVASTPTRASAARTERGLAVRRGMRIWGPSVALARLAHQPAADPRDHRCETAAPVNTGWGWRSLTVGQGICESAKVVSVQRVAWNNGWTAWCLCGVLNLVGGALLRPSRAEAPKARVDAGTAKTRADAGAPKARADGGAPKASAKAPANQPRAKAPVSKIRAKTRAPKTRTTPSVSKPSAKVRTSKQSAAKRPALAEDLDVASGPDEACHLQLRKAGVPFVKILTERAPDVQLPIRLTGAVAGVEIRGTGKKATHYMDCRLALALVRWAPLLGAAGVVRIDHYSIYRQDAQVGATRKPSGHAGALAIDAGRFHLSDGRLLTVLDTWTDKTKGGAACSPRPQQGADERLLRELVCDAARRGIFQTIVTPHHNPDHDNHVHLEVSGSLAPTWIH
jgi:hypothetical protein